ncbi:hypothetical protein H0H92_007508 [Tricholoma furcatifolium]|nr:hypothetical protein H0H92_007508 [Tricholoma furcatifolium]
MVRGDPPPPLTSHHQRRSSASSMSSTSSSGSSRTSSPNLTSLDSSAALILVHDEDDQLSPFNFDSDDDEDDDHTSPFDVRRASTPPLNPSNVLLYLLVPFLKLGAMFLPHTETPLKYGLPALFSFAVLASFARQLLYMLSRYTRTAELEDVILALFARGRGKEKRRSILRGVVRAFHGGFRVLLATVYLRGASFNNLLQSLVLTGLSFPESVHVLLPLLPNGNSIALQLGLTALFSLAVSPLSFAQSLASRRILYTTWLSLAAYIIWLACTTYAYIHNVSLGNEGWLRTGTFWQGLVTIAFAFTSSSTLSLYSSLRGSYQPVSTAKPSKFRSFKLLSALSVLLAVLLTLPLVIFSANPTIPTTQSVPHPAALAVIPILNAVTLLLSIPCIMTPIPSLPVPERLRHASMIPLSKMLLTVLTSVLSLVPPKAYIVLSDILLLCALTSTYFLPAVLHVTAHFFERPLTILTPQPHSAGGRPRESGSGPDELLLRKERALQKRQFRRRIVWDLGVWLLLLGGGAGFVAALGRVVGWW